MEYNDKFINIKKNNKIEHNEEILREIRNRITIEIWSIVLTSLAHGMYMYLRNVCI